MPKGPQYIQECKYYELKFGKWDNFVNICMTNQMFGNINLQGIHKVKIYTKVDSDFPAPP